MNRASTVLSSKYTLPLIIFGMFGIAGCAYLLSSRATTPLVSTETELGLITSPAKREYDASASADSYILFGAGTVSPPPTDEFPTIDTTGPRTTSLTASGGVTSTSAGQLIERKNITGQLKIAHDNVTVRDVRVNGIGTYMVTVVPKSGGSCPTGVRFEYIEINGVNAAENDIPVYANCPFVIDRAYVHNVGRSSRLTNNQTIENSYIFSDRTGDSGAHRGGVGINGGNNNIIRNNVLKCRGVGCSAAIPNYGDFSTVSNLLIEHNLVSTSGGYCMYGGSLDSKPYPDGSNIRIINNHFSREFNSKCGQFGPLAGWEGNIRGNVSSGNIWHETGEPIVFPDKLGV